MSEGALRAPFPYFGGKRRAAPLVWDALGNPSLYVEPFCGSAAVLLARVGPRAAEHLNDMDAMIVNFWRAVRQNPMKTLEWAEWPVSEIDLHARHAWVIAQRARLEEGLTDPNWCDPKVAGWWVWGLGLWIGDGWAVSASRKLPAIGGEGRGIHSPRRAPTVGDPKASRGSLEDWFLELSGRLQGVAITRGGWQDPLDITKLLATHETLGVFLDPPYSEGKMDYAAGGTGTSLSAHVREWAVTQGHDPRVRIVLAGYEGEHEPPGWSVVEWLAQGGYAVQGTSARADNRKRERLWLSPHCLQAGTGTGQVLDLFGEP